MKTPLLNAIKTLSSAGWYGFHLGKNEHGTSKVDLFSPTAQDAGILGNPPPKKLVAAANYMDWMSVPGDNIDGKATNRQEKKILSTTPQERAEKTASITPLLDGISKHAVSGLMWGLGGLGAGAIGIPILKKKYLGIHPETQQLLEEGDPYYGRPAPIVPSRFLRLAR